MKVRHGIIAALAVLGAGAVAGGLWSRTRTADEADRTSRPRSVPPEERQGAAANDAARAQLVELHRAAVEAAREARAAEPAQEAAESEPAGAGEPEDDPEREQRIAGVVEAQFQADPAPVAESWRMRGIVEAAFQRFADAGLEVKGVECRFRLCRLDLKFESTAADVEVLSEIFLRGGAMELHEFGAMLAPAREYLADGSVKTTLYLARSGDIDTLE